MITVTTFTDIISQLLPEPHAGLLAGIVFGTKATLSKDLTNNLITTGTLHIVALSGMNITILSSLVNKTLLNFIPRRIATGLTLFLIIAFIWFVGPSPSVVRAGIMGAISLLAIIFGRQVWALWSWLIAVVIMLAINFSWLTDLSFQLSALATLGLILFGKTLQPPLNSFKGFYRNLKESMMDDLHTTLAAQIFTVPLIFFTFHRVSLISPLTNILIGWTIAPLTVIGWLVSVLGFIWLPLGQIVAWFAWVWLQYVLIAIEWTSKIPLSSLAW